MNINTLKEEEFKNSQYIKPKRFTYIKDNKKHTWDFIKSKDSVSILLYHKNLNSYILVKQFRIPLWYYQIKNNINTKDIGYSIELCSGLVDKDLDLKDIAIEECIEELGYKPKNIEKIQDFYNGFGSGCSKQTLFLAIVDEDDKISEGGGIDGEEIEAIYININEFENYLKDKFYSPLLSFVHLWFLKRTN